MSDSRESGTRLRPGSKVGLAPLPTRKTLFWRTFLPWQVWKFVWINWKMVRVITKGHRRRNGKGASASTKR